MEIKNLHLNKVYEIRHTRKGEFVAILLDIVPADEGDDQDEVYLHVRYDVRTGTDQARLQTRAKQEYRESNIRPSLIAAIIEHEGEHWLRQVVPPRPPRGQGKKTNQPPESLLKKVKGLFGGN